MKTISFVNMKGGVGKTTLALNVADCLARKHSKKVAIVDVDPQFNATQCLLTGEEYVALLKGGEDTIMNVFDTDIQSISSVVKGAAAAKPKELADIKLKKQKHLWILPGNIDLYRLEMIAGEGREFALRRFIEVLKKQGFDYVVIDTPPTPSMWMTSALIASDYFVIPVKPDPLSMIGIDLLRSIIERRRKSYDLKIECLGVVFTMVERPDSVVYHTAKANLQGNAFWKNSVLPRYLPKRTELVKQQLEQPFILTMDDFDLRESLSAIVDAMLEEMEDD